MLSSGVPRGFVLGPFLFNVYKSALIYSISKCDMIFETPSNIDLTGFAQDFHILFNNRICPRQSTRGIRKTFSLSN